MARKIRVNAMSLGLLMRTLYEGPNTLAELAEITGLGYGTVREWVNELHAQKVVHITGYERDSRDRDNAPLWQFGVDKRDVKRRTLTGAERQERHRQKTKALKLVQMMAGAVA